MTLPRLNMNGWTIDSFELAYAGLQHINDATRLVQNQPRASGPGGDYHPGADFIVQVGEDWCGARLDDLMERLKGVRFPDPEHDERRVLLLVTYASSHGPASESLASIVKMALDQAVRPA